MIPSFINHYLFGKGHRYDENARQLIFYTRKGQHTFSVRHRDPLGGMTNRPLVVSQDGNSIKVKAIVEHGCDLYFCFESNYDTNNTYSVYGDSETTSYIIDPTDSQLPATSFVMRDGPGTQITHLISKHTVIPADAINEFNVQIISAKTIQKNDESIDIETIAQSGFSVYPTIK